MYEQNKAPYLISFSHLNFKVPIIPPDRPYKPPPSTPPVLLLLLPLAAAFFFILRVYRYSAIDTPREQTDSEPLLGAAEAQKRERERGHITYPSIYVERKHTHAGAWGKKDNNNNSER